MVVAGLRRRHLFEWPFNSTPRSPSTASVRRRSWNLKSVGVFGPEGHAYWFEHEGVLEWSLRSADAQDHCFPTDLRPRRRKRYWCSTLHDSTQSYKYVFEKKAKSWARFR
ncbi:uncharacterized protein FOMMEDRAFT_142489 [Fomitiporia mediterranea MF3/22]|uniref:uncharacterized protein n=1 Tax=Fomitiporia mediterranea (strain MF3/22) TaxID=694068 RepID=UPI00044088A0|nr:uncharacterized protein FOMMEDRAFT_142489 [Fomitiporia mediterranea MF3/22]EJC99987.1 hypothetical protein FOMMEDRAFT_142489 [Fomitiporia mediterranea MF3/22]